ncbi:hypothetical protein C8Q75DRAFT_740632 [Abortiporus biennis]|nr:hypothetical protein C8Q75DRAFT_740632 [Abortiporus biennis]
MASVEGLPACLLASVPVMQPPHLEGDASLATEILPGPPPLLSLQQTGQSRKDHKKTAPAFSYLPVSDPGTTYTGHMVAPVVTTAAPTLNEVDGPRRKRARVDKGSASGRAQRASARNLTAMGTSNPPTDTPASSSHIIPDIEVNNIDSDDPMLSRSNSVTVEDQPPAPVIKLPRRDKVKGKEKESVRIKEEPMLTTLNGNDSGPTLPNEDHCSACNSFGSLVYCDGCPRAFHLWCLNPPMEASDLQGDARWYCPSCMLRQKPPSKVPAFFKFMAPLIEQIQHTVPVEYQLPQEIRTHFKDVATSTRGSYVDSSEIKQPRLNRHGQLEDRDPYRLKDRNGDPVLCFRCGTSALPAGVAASAPAAKRPRRAASIRNTSESGRGIVSCDYCHLHWHLDCLDPPLSFVPPMGKKWKCPNHADNVTHPKRRIPRHNPTVIDITKPGQFNNGNIDIIQPEAFVTATPPKVAVEEVLINGRRYRVPERIVTMDFWNKTRKKSGHEAQEMSSGLSSPLTELSSLEDMDDAPEGKPQSGLFNVEELKAALLLCGLHDQAQQTAVHPLTRGDVALGRERAVQTELAWAFTSVGESSSSLLKIDDSKISNPKNSKKQNPPRPVRAASSRPLRSAILLPRLSEASSSIAQTSSAQPSINGKQDSGADLADNEADTVSSRLRRTRQSTRKRLPPIPTTATSRLRSTDSITDIESEDEDDDAGTTAVATIGPPSAKTTPSTAKTLNGSISAKPVTPVPKAGAITHDPSATPTTTLKIRLPGRAALHSPISAPPTAAQQIDASLSPTRGKGKGTNHTRPRRSNRQASSATPVNETPA